MKNKSNNLKAFISEIILEMLLNEAIPMPPMLQQQLQQQKAVLQQMLGSGVQKGTNVQGNPLVNSYIQQALASGIRDPQQMLAGFDQYFLKSQQGNIMNQIGSAKKNIVAPPRNLGQQATAGKAVPTFGQGTFNPQDPFGTKAREIDRAALQRHQQNLAQLRAADEKASEHEKQFAAKQQAASKATVPLKKKAVSPPLQEVIKLMIYASNQEVIKEHSGDKYYVSALSKYKGLLKEDVEYLDGLYFEFKCLTPKLKVI